MDVKVNPLDVLFLSQAYTERAKECIAEGTAVYHVYRNARAAAHWAIIFTKFDGSYRKEWSPEEQQAEATATGVTV